MQDILRAFPAVLKHLDTEGDAVEPVVLAAWRRVVDGALAENIVPLRLENNRLIAAVSSETWRRQVADLGPVLAERLNDALGAKLVKFIQFEIDARVVAEHRKSLRQNEAADIERSQIEDQLRGDLEPASESIADDRLRETFLAAAAASLARRANTSDKADG